VLLGETTRCTRSEGLLLHLHLGLQLHLHLGLQLNLHLGLQLHLHLVLPHRRLLLEVLGLELRHPVQRTLLEVGSLEPRLRLVVLVQSVNRNNHKCRSITFQLRRRCRQVVLGTMTELIALFFFRRVCSSSHHFLYLLFSFQFLYDTAGTF